MRITKYLWLIIVNLNMKRIHITESQLLNETHYEAGTDFPTFYDEKTDTWYEAQWNGDYGFPFGFWPDDYNGVNEVFSVGDAWSTHENACGKVAKEYCFNIINELVGEDISAIVERVNDIMSNISEYGYTWDSKGAVFVSADGSDEIDLWNEADDLRGELRFIVNYDLLHDIIENAIENDGNIDENALQEEVIERIFDGYDFTERDGINNALLEIVGEDFNSFFEKGNGEGRIWPRAEMIGFYETEQPDPQRLNYILQLLSQHEEIGCSYDEMLQFHMVFEDWRNDGTITACTVQDYIDGNYGPESYEDLDDDEDDTPIQYNNGQKTVFVPHLANQQDKFNYYRDFRNTRDRAVYTPQERAAGNLAAYHAMRYPYGESKNKIGKIIREVIEKNIQETYPPLTELENGVYEGYYYAYTFELRDGRKYRTKIGIRCSKKGCGGLKKFKITGDGTPHQIENKMGD